METLYPWLFLCDINTFGYKSEFVPAKLLIKVVLYQFISRTHNTDIFTWCAAWLAVCSSSQLFSIYLWCRIVKCNHIILHISNSLIRHYNSNANLPFWNHWSCFLVKFTLSKELQEIVLKQFFQKSRKRSRFITRLLYQDTLAMRPSVGEFIEKLNMFIETEFYSKLETKWERFVAFILHIKMINDEYIWCCGIFGSLRSSISTI